MSVFFLNPCLFSEPHQVVLLQVKLVLFFNTLLLRKNDLYLKFFWSEFFRIWTEHEDLQSNFYVFSPNVGKYWQEKLWIWMLLTKWSVMPKDLYRRHWKWKLHNTFLKQREKQKQKQQQQQQQKGARFCCSV